MAPKILVVDDEPDLEQLIKQKFRKEIKNNTYDFTFAENGVQALEELKMHNGIELVLTDINMPEMDGLTLLSEMQNLNNPLLRSVIVSAYGDIANIRTAMNRGAYDFVIKPIDLNDLEITITKALADLKTLKEAFKSREDLIIVQKELEEARQLQLSMLPKELPKNNDLDIAVHMKTATEVGGDYYDFSRLEDGSLNVGIGDATGHGMNAGIMVSVMKALFTSKSIGMNILDFFSSSNNAIKQMNLGRMMMAFTMLNIKDGKLKLGNAGMPPVYIYRQSNSKIEEIEFTGMPLGAMADANFEVNELDIQSEDTLLMLSDGLPELKNESNEMYGYDRIKTEFQLVGGKGPEEIIEHLKDTASDWVNGKGPEDDVTFVVIKVK
ncbi:PP2C family protein-serine/threonine phosphatase [Bacteroidota bacterium]